MRSSTRVRDRWLADYLWPALHGDLTGDEDGLASVALLDNLQQVAPALGGEALQPPVIEDQQGDPAQAAHQTIERAFVAGSRRVPSALPSSVFDHLKVEA